MVAGPHLHRGVEIRVYVCSMRGLRQRHTMTKRVAGENPGSLHFGDGPLRGIMDKVLSRQGVASGPEARTDMVLKPVTNGE